MLLAKKSVLLIAALTAMAACGDVVNQVDAGGDGDGDGDGDFDAAVNDPCEGSISAEDFPTCYANAICQAFTNCQSFGPAFVDIQECLDNYEALFPDFVNQIERIAAGIQAGAINMDGALMAQCLGGIDTCNLSNDACEIVFTGNTPDGGVCFEDFECGNGGDCGLQPVGGPVNQCQTGICTYPVGLGAACGGQVRCENGLRCVTDGGGNQVCRDGVAGDPCNSSFDCDELLTCDANDTCVPRVADGAACLNTDECLIPSQCINSTCQTPDANGDPCNGNCLGPLFCDATDTCRPLPGAGQDCSQSNRCLGATLFCDSGGTNTCLALPGLGQSCNTNGPECLPGLFCDQTDPNNPLCANRRADGQPCNNDDECAGNVCNAGVCEDFDVCYGN